MDRTSKTDSATSSGVASAPSQEQRPDTSPGYRALTPSEIESLQRDKRETIRRLDELEAQDKARR